MPDRERVPRDLGELWDTLVLVFMALLIVALAITVDDQGDRIRRLEDGRQQSVSAPECPPAEGATGHAQDIADQGLREAFGPLAQLAEQRTFNPLSACTPAQPEAKLRGNPADFDARSASGCAGLHADRVSGGRQEVAP